MKKLILLILVGLSTMLSAQIEHHELFDELNYAEPWKVLPVDWMNDGVMDVFVFVWQPLGSTLSGALYLNDGNGNLSYSLWIANIGEWVSDPIKLYHTDLDGDGNFELVIEEYDTIWALDYEDPFSFPMPISADPWSYLTEGWSSAPVYAIAFDAPERLVDFDQDGDLDLASNIFNENSQDLDDIWIVNQEGFSDGITVPRVGNYLTPSRDWNLDGLGDSYQTVPGVTPGTYDLICTLQEIGGLFTDEIVIYSYSDTGPSAAYFVDLNNDGHDDILLLRDGIAQVAFGDAEQNFGLLQLFSSQIPVDGRVLFSDYNNDGFKDVLIYYGGGENLQFIQNNAGNGFLGVTVIQDMFGPVYLNGNFLTIDLDGLNGLDYVGILDERQPFTQLTVQLQFENDFHSALSHLDTYLGYNDLFDEPYFVNDFDSNGHMDILMPATYYPQEGVVILDAYTESPILQPINNDPYLSAQVDLVDNVENEWLGTYYDGAQLIIEYSVLNTTTWVVESISSTPLSSDVNSMSHYYVFDFNQDGLNDVLISGDYQYTYDYLAFVLLSNGDSSFEALALDLPEAANNRFSGFHDLNEDGLMEFYFSNDDGTFKLVMDGLGNWSPQIEVYDLPIALKYTVNDELSNQKYMVASMHNGAYEYVDFLFDVTSDGQLSNMRNLRSEIFPNSPWTSNLCFDIDQDGFLEFVSNIGGSSFIVTDFVSGNLVYNIYNDTDYTRYPTSDTEWQAGDLNGDGAMDIYSSHQIFCQWFENLIPFGCQDPAACNFSQNILGDQGLCCYNVCGCTDSLSCNYNAIATCDDASCDPHGCMDQEACNFDPNATCDDGSCNTNASNIICSISSDDLDMNSVMFEISFQSLLGFPEPRRYALFELDTDVLVAEFNCVPHDCFDIQLTPFAGYIDSAIVSLQISTSWGAVVFEEANRMEDFIGYNSNVENQMFFCLCGTNEIHGCTNSEAMNFNAQATCDDGSCLYLISGRVFNDIDANGVFDGDDYGLPFQQITIEPDNMVVYTDNDGFYALEVGMGSFYIEHVYEPNFAFYSTPSSYIGLSQEYMLAGANFGVSATQPFANICLDIYPDWYLCDDMVNYNLCFRNLGNYPINGILAFTYDDIILGHQAVTPIDSTIGHTVYFSYEDLLPGEMFFYDILLQTPDFELIGETMIFNGVISALSGGALVGSGFKTLLMEHACSYDPNDKIGYPIGYTESHFVEDGTAIEYVVRFQNTGNAPALNVRIEDQLDENLDLSSFELVANSHSVITVLDEDQRGLTFYFNNIMLPDSATDEPASNGLVSYRIALKDPLPTGTEIHNTASIYFDNNPAVVTNTTLHTIYNCEDFVTDLTVDDSEWCATQTLRINTAAPWADAYIWSVNGLIESESEELLLTEAGEKHISLMVDNPLCGLFEESITLNIDDLPTQSITASATSICEGETADLVATYPGEVYSWSINDQVISTDAFIVAAAAGTYELTTTMGECVQTNSIDIVVTPMPQVNITQSINVLTTLFDADWTYQWYFNNEPIAGAVSSAYEIVSSGTYAVQVSNGLCTQSMETNATFISVTNDFQNDVGIYPNPTRGDLMLTNLDAYIGNTLMMYDLTGRVIFSEKVTTNTLKVKTQEWAAGLYRINLGNQMHLQFVKLDD